ncbi:MAG: hypothetical protein IKF46_01380 [Erysipelotrichaceae bacterium]|nr:hypothetical protein [Erysipelotrichaceae bacterium]
MSENSFNFTNVVYKFRGKNGEVFFNKDDQIHIRRWGWFDIPYQFFTQGSTLFTVDELEEIVIQEPGMMRGYIDFKLKGGKRKGRVWLTNMYQKMLADDMKKRIDHRMRKLDK